MTMTKIILVLALILLLAAPSVAQETDLNTMTPSELQAYVQTLQDQAEQPIQPIQPTVITIQPDAQLNENIQLLMGEMADMKGAMSAMQERFNRLATDTKEEIRIGGENVITVLGSANREQRKEQTGELEEYINQKTNPVRQTAPSIGVFMILTGAFLLWACKQYNLTGGARSGRGKEGRH